ncbi:MAG: methylmalonyl Co-A mutase-associated GTPase MeaB [Kiloniellales bacterium]
MKRGAVPAPRATEAGPEQTEKLVAEVLSGDRRALARAITLIESTRPGHRPAAEALLEALLPHSGGALRIGISGSPGVGKSTLVERLGLQLVEAGHRLAVLAVDPSSPRSKGSILGDKTRMESLAAHADTFIRPSPSGGSLGGVARRTREALLACEAAGFDIVIVETVGVGQSEVAVADMVDVFVLLLQPGSGDVLQGLKKGIVELADLVLVNKADGELESAASRAAADYQEALQLLRPATPHWRPRVLKCSALTGQGLAEIWAALQEHRKALEEAGALAHKRAGQARAWFWKELGESLLAALRAQPGVEAELARLEAEVAAGTLAPAAAVRRLLAAQLPGPSP